MTFYINYNKHNNRIYVIKYKGNQVVSDPKQYPSARGFSIRNGDATWYFNYENNIYSRV